MSTNSSSPSTELNSSNFVIEHCIQSKPSFIMFSSFHITSTLLLLPLCTFILHHGLQQWWQKHSTSSAVTVSHSDYLTYHMVIMDLIRMLGGAILLCGVYMVDLNILLGGLFAFSYPWFGQMSLHVLTCVERYLAVVHPITYRNLKTERGIRIRNIITACVWLLCFALMGVQMTKGNIIVNLCLLLFCLSVVSFCSLSVLCVLTRSGPGDKGGHKESIDQSKLRAFYTITAILGLLVLRFAWGMTWILSMLELTDSSCAIMMCEVWFDLLSSLVLPLLYLNRAGKLERCKKIISIC